jgi:D-lactate dehydrogenase (cytochrome)
MAATRASGTNTVRYGTMRENVLAMQVALPDGRLIRTGGRARKSSAGYDLTRLFIGAEGTLGLITELTLRLHARPEAISSAVCPFPELKQAVETVIHTIRSAVPVARIELLDEVMIDAVNRYSDLDNTVSPTLFFEFHGSRRSVTEQAEVVQSIAKEHGGAAFRWTADPEERRRLWRARHDAYHAARALRPETVAFSTDACVPISNLTACILETKKDLANTSIPAPLAGHVGDGNFHLIMLVDPTNPEEMNEARTLHERLVSRALALDGTCTGEHGIGIGKAGFMVAEHGEAVEVMRSIKRALDPGDVMNPGKTLPPGD